MYTPNYRFFSCKFVEQKYSNVISNKERWEIIIKNIPDSRFKRITLLIYALNIVQELNNKQLKLSNTELFIN